MMTTTEKAAAVADKAPALSRTAVLADARFQAAGLFARAHRANQGNEGECV